MSSERLVAVFFVCVLSGVLANLIDAQYFGLYISYIWQRWSLSSRLGRKSAATPGRLGFNNL